MSEIRSRLIHGFLEACLLSLLSTQPDYGLALGQRLAAAGLDDVPGGTLYPALLRLEKRGWVAVRRKPSDAGPPRKWYTITADGLTALAERRLEWSQFVATVGAIIEQPSRQDAR